MAEDRAEWFAALRQGDLATVERLLAAEPALAQARQDSGLSSVTWACYCRQWAVVDRLRRAGPGLDLFEAVACGDEARVEVLLQQDPAVAQAWSADGFTALHLAAFFARPALARRLVALGADVLAVSRNDLRVQPLQSSAAAGELDVARTLLEHGADPNAREGAGFTPLMAAAGLGHDALAALLLEHGATPGLESPDGQSAADIAEKSGHAALAARLRLR